MLAEFFKLCVKLGMFSIYDYVMQELAKYPGEISPISKEAGVTYSWLRQVASGQIPNPGIKGIERVAKALQKRAP